MYFNKIEAGSQIKFEYFSLSCCQKSKHYIDKRKALNLSRVGSEITFAGVGMYIGGPKFRKIANFIL